MSSLTRASHRPWATPGLIPFMLDSVVANTSCHEQFNDCDQSAWIKFSQALAWAGKEFQKIGLTSWIMGYPIVGLLQLITTINARIKAWIDVVSEDMRLTKLMHVFSSVFLAKMSRLETKMKDKDHVGAKAEHLRSR